MNDITALIERAKECIAYERTLSAPAEHAISIIEEMIEALSCTTAQLPEGMKHCTIQYKECEKGHGRLTADNWIDHGCQQCEIDLLSNSPLPEEVEELSKQVLLVATEGLDSGGVPRGTFADDHVRNLVAMYNQLKEKINTITGLDPKLMEEGNQPAYYMHNFHESVGHLYYFGLLNVAEPPYHTQRHVDAIIDIANDGTLAGVELIEDMPPPPNTK